MIDEEVARNLEAQLQAGLEKEERLLAERLQAEEQEELSIEERSKLFVELINERKKHFARLRAEEKRRKPPTKAQKRNQMCTYLKNMAGFTPNKLKNKSFKEVQKAFDNTMSWINSFVPKDKEVAEGSKTRVEGSSKRAGEELESNKSKKKKLNEKVNKARAVMSFASSAVTYTSVYTNSEPGRPVAPPSQDYIPGPEEPQTLPVPHDEDKHEPMFIQPHDLDYVPEPMYPKYISIEDEHVLPAEEQPLPPIDSPTAESPRYVAESDPEEDIEEDDADDEDEVKEDEEEEHIALADSAIVIPTFELAAITLPPEAKVKRLLAMPTPPPSPLTSLSQPFTRERLDRCTTLSACPLPPPIPSPLLPSFVCPTQIQTLRMASTQALINAVTTALPSPPLPPPLYIPPPVDHRDDIPKTEMPPRKRLCLSTLGSRYEAGESSTARPTGGRRIDYGFFSTVDAEVRQRGNREVGYGIRDTWVDPAEPVLEIAPMTLGEVNTRVTELAELHEQIMALVTRQGPNILPNNTNPNNMTPESVQAMIDQVLMRNSTNRDGSHRTEGVVGLTRWIEKMESVFQISGCAIENQFVANEIEKIDKYISGLPDNIFGSFKSSKHKTLDETIELDNDFMDQKLRTYAERQTDNKRKVDDSSRNNHGHQQQPFKRQNFAKVYAVGNAEKKGNASRDPNFNVITGSSYDIELADGKIVEVDTIMRGCTLNFLNHPFNIDLMLVELGSFDVIIDMDWLRRCHAVIVCDEKLVRIPYGNETLIFCSNESNDGRESRLTIISCSKAQEYMAKGCQIFLAQISAKKEEDKSKGKQLKDVKNIVYKLNEADIKISVYVVPTGRVVVPTGRYAVPTGRVVVPIGRVISPGKIPTGRNFINFSEKWSDFRKAYLLRYNELRVVPTRGFKEKS
uniref:Reverse transcriptase domain-containing protein n=1 Tax=Tanacetum cinerariifolium TaxID=118510 RepID=A0A6L2J001_TANCI|nr:reverse transcriptase domain-containing protein [Tanacetum cinerariifolium]